MSEPVVAPFRPSPVGAVLDGGPGALDRAAGHAVAVEHGTDR